MPNVIGWKLDPGQRAELLQQFPPLYSNVIADHVTLRSGVPPDAQLPGEAEARSSAAPTIARESRRWSCA